jgi:hypothetical protein
LDPQLNEDADLQPEENRRSEKRLARGLEDVSYLFLSSSGAEADKGAGRNTPSEQARPQPTPPPASPFILRASSGTNRELLISMLSNNAAVLEEGLRFIDLNIPCDPFGSIDLLLLDSLDQLVIVAVDAVQNDGMFLRGIGCFDWIVRNTPVLRRMYQGRIINFSAQPRLLLIAPSFSPLLKCAAQRSLSPKISCLAYHAVALPGGVGILFEPV